MCIGRFASILKEKNGTIANHIPSCCLAGVDAAVVPVLHPMVGFDLLGLLALVGQGRPDMVQVPRRVRDVLQTNNQIM